MSLVLGVDAPKIRDPSLNLGVGTPNIGDPSPNNYSVIILAKIKVKNGQSRKRLKKLENFPMVEWEVGGVPTFEKKFLCIFG